ncbi:hypothetical protein PYW08_014079 [Mythimna loreyi]|uniref:Uncharacterized protein n=1 Tax=Mythimna loreyi TaxID=667449 RepID=A0ACC2R956_9NEOP|nr:hypothetical protein PYW08_014079 [Mythimna loreyi]
MSIVLIAVEASSTRSKSLTPEQVIHLLSEQVRNLIRSGDADNGVPVLDPYEFEWRQVNINAGDKFSIEVQNISLWGTVYLKQSADGKSILLDIIEDPEFSIEHIVSRTQFDNNIDGIINAMIDDLLADYLTRFNKYIAASYTHKVAPLVNPALDNYDNWNLIAALLFGAREIVNSRRLSVRKTTRMKLVLVLMLCAMVAAAPKVGKPTPVRSASAIEDRNVLVNALIRQFFAYVRRVINNGSSIFGIPPLDPLELEHYHLYIPAGLINLDLELNKILATGIGSFEVNRSHLDLHELSFDLDITVPRLDAAADEYDLIGDFFTAIPLYGKGKAKFVIEDFRFRAKLFLKQSEDELSVLIDRIENASFEIPSFKSELTGVIGGGDIDGIVNSMIEEVIIDYVNRFQGAIAAAGSKLAIAGLNPILDQLDTWSYIAVLLPRPPRTE